MGKEVVILYFRVIFQYLAGGTQETAGYLSREVSLRSEDQTPDLIHMKQTQP
jgi:hypothetical protein